MSIELETKETRNIVATIVSVPFERMYRQTHGNQFVADSIGGFVGEFRAAAEGTTIINKTSNKNVRCVIRSEICWS